MSYETRSSGYGVGHCIRPTNAGGRMTTGEVGVLSFVTGMMFMMILDLMWRLV